jgi:hypothetical protein
MKVKFFTRNECGLNDQMQECWSAGLAQLFVDTSRDAAQRSLPRQEMFLAVMGAIFAVSSRISGVPTSPAWMIRLEHWSQKMRCPEVPVQ